MTDPNATEDELHYPSALQQAIGFVKVLELDATAARARVLYEGRPEFTHSGGTTVQGGILTAWLDNAMARAVTARDPKAGVASLEIKTSFLGRVGPGTSVVEARVVRWGRRVLFLEAELLAADGKPLVKASSSALLV